MTLGTYIKEARLKLGLTQRDLGEKIGVTNMFISSLEMGKAPIPLDRLKKIIEILGLSRKKVIMIARDQFTDDMEDSL